LCTPVLQIKYSHFDNKAQKFSLMIYIDDDQTFNLFNLMFYINRDACIHAQLETKKKNSPL